MPPRVTHVFEPFFERVKEKVLDQVAEAGAEVLLDAAAQFGQAALDVAEEIVNEASQTAFDAGFIQTLPTSGGDEDEGVADAGPSSVAEDAQGGADAADDELLDAEAKSLEEDVPRQKSTLFAAVLNSEMSQSGPILSKVTNARTKKGSLLFEFTLEGGSPDKDAVKHLLAALNNAQRVFSTKDDNFQVKFRHLATLDGEGGADGTILAQEEPMTLPKTFPTPVRVVSARKDVQAAMKAGFLVFFARSGLRARRADEDVKEVGVSGLTTPFRALVRNIMSHFGWTFMAGEDLPQSSRSPPSTYALIVPKEMSRHNAIVRMSAQRRFIKNVVARLGEARVAKIKAAYRENSQPEPNVTGVNAVIVLSEAFLYSDADAVETSDMVTD